LILFCKPCPSLAHIIQTWDEFQSDEKMAEFFTHYVSLFDICATLVEPEPKNILLDISERLERLEKFLVI